MSKKSFFQVMMVVVFLVGLVVNLSSPNLVLATPADQGCWYYKTDMVTARSGLAVAELNDQIYVIGGQNDDERYQLNELYDPIADSWTDKEPMTTARAWLVAEVAEPSPGVSRVYAIGGSAQGTRFNTVEMYDPDTNSWFPRSPMSNPRHGAVAGVVDNKIYVIGGWRNSPLNSVEEYDPVANIWSNKAPLPNDVAFASSAVVDDKIYVIGGLDDTGVISSTYEYDPGADTWTQKANMPLPSHDPNIEISARNRLAAAAVGDKIYVLGGTNFPDWWLDTVQVYDPASDTWGEMNWMPTARGEIAAAAVGDTIYTFGGKRNWDSEDVKFTHAIDVDCDNHPPEKPFDPIPEHSLKFQDVDVNLNWSGGDLDETEVNFPTYNVYFSEAWDDSPRTTPPLVSSDQAPTTYQPQLTLKPHTKYNWQIVAQDSTEAVTSGDLWAFWTGSGPYLDVDKQAEPLFIRNTGETVTYTVSITNTGDISATLRTLVDDIHGDVDGQGDCAISATEPLLIPDENFTCSFTSFESGSVGQVITDTVTASAETSAGVMAIAQDSARVTVCDHLVPTIEVTKSADPDLVPETGGSIVEYSVQVQNFFCDPLTLESLNDDVFGNIADAGNTNIVSTTCSVPSSLETGNPYECTFSAVLPSGNAGAEHTNTVTAAASGGAVASADATVTYEDVKPDNVGVTKWGNPGIVTEPGGDVNYIVTVENLGDETIFLGALTDDIFGDLDGQGTCEISDTLIPAGETYACAFTGAVSGSAGDEHINTVTALIYDDEDNLRFPSDDFKVNIVDYVIYQLLLPLILVDGP